MAAFGSGIILLAIVVCVYSQAQYFPGDCPGGRKVGDQWSRPGCVGCTCDQSGYACYGCGLTPPTAPGCTLKQNTSAPHPQCCPKEVCPTAVG